MPHYSLHSLSKCPVCLFVSLLCALIVEKCGRKILYLSGFGMVIIGLSLLFVSSFVSITSSLRWICSIAGMSLMMNGHSLGPVLSFILPSELCPAAIKAKTVAFSQTICHFLLVIIVFCFPPLYNIVGSYVLLPLLGVSLFIWVFALIFFPETKGKHLRK